MIKEFPFLRNPPKVTKHVVNPRCNGCDGKTREVRLETDYSKYRKRLLSLDTGTIKRLKHKLKVKTLQIKTKVNGRVSVIEL